MIRRTLRRLRSDEAGLSLAELLVSAAITLIILAMVGSFLISAAKITSNSTQTSESTADAANIANEITGVVRVATTVARSGGLGPLSAVVSGTKETLSIYSLSNTDAGNPAPVRVEFTIDTTTTPGSRILVEKRCKSTSSSGFWVFGSCTITTRRLGGNLLSSTSVDTQLFTYYDAANHVVPFDSSGKIGATDLAKVASIRVYVSVKANGAKTKQVVISNLVVLGNLGLDSSS